MTQLNQIYRCNICGNIVAMIHEGKGELVCCGQPMELLEEKNQDTGQEKHIPVPEKTNHSIKVKVGPVPHPMEEGHFIEWIEIITEDNKTGRKFLKPGNKPEGEFFTKSKPQRLRAYCNIHGLWQGSCRSCS